MKIIKKLLFVTAFSIIFGLIGIQKVNAAVLADCYYHYDSSTGSYGKNSIYVEIKLTMEQNINTKQNIYTKHVKVWKYAEAGTSDLNAVLYDSDGTGKQLITFNGGLDLFTEEDFIPAGGNSKTICPTDVYFEPMNYENGITLYDDKANTDEGLDLTKPVIQGNSIYGLYSNPAFEACKDSEGSSTAHQLCIENYNKSNIGTTEPTAPTMEAYCSYIIDDHCSVKVQLYSDKTTKVFLYKESYSGGGYSSVFPSTSAVNYKDFVGDSGYICPRINTETYTDSDVCTQSTVNSLTVSTCSSGDDCKSANKATSSTESYADGTPVKDTYGNPIVNTGETDKLDCDSFKTNDGVDILNDVFTIMKILGPILLIIFGGIDFAKAALISDADAIQKSVQKFVKRLIAAALLFLIPTILSVILGFAVDAGVFTDENIPQTCINSD